MTKKSLKKAYLSRLCQLIGIEDLPLGVGSSLPRPLFDALARLFDVSVEGSMPEVDERVATAALVP